MANPYNQHPYGSQYVQHTGPYARGPPSSEAGANTMGSSQAPSGYSMPPGGQYGQPGYYPQPQQQIPQSYSQGAVPDAFMSGIAADVLQQSGKNYLQQGQAFMQSKMGFLSSSNLRYHFNVDSEYVRNKLLMLLVPFLRRWTYTRTPEQITGGHKYVPPRQDTNAPDLYVPFMAVCTYIVLKSVSQTVSGRFTHDNMYVTVSGAFTAWALHWLLLKVVLYALGIPSAVPFLEILAYSGYPFVHACVGMLAWMLGGLWPWRLAWVYGSLSMGVFMVRTMKRVIFHESRQYGGGSALHNYILLGLAVCQFFLLLWLAF